MKYKYPFTNEIVFSLVMQNKEICKGLLELIFPERKIRDLRLHESHVDVEKMIIVGVEARKVRLDVLFEDSDAWYDIEMQSRDERNIPKRTRYSHGITDVNTLRPGQEFNELKASYVIFLCRFDPFGYGEAVYRFQMYDEQKHLSLGDESYTIILNSKADESRTDQSLRELFRYVNDDVVAEKNELLRQIDKSVESWNTNEGVTVMVSLEQELSIREARAVKKAREIALAEGRAEGMEEGRRQEQLRTAKKLKESGVAISIIVSCTGLPEADVEQI